MVLAEALTLNSRTTRREATVIEASVAIEEIVATAVVITIIEKEEADITVQGPTILHTAASQGRIIIKTTEKASS